MTEDGRSNERAEPRASFAHIDVAFCVGCNYQPRAVALADTLRRAYPESTVTMTPTGGGAFEVTADGRNVFSKQELGRHAQPGEVIAALQSLHAVANQHLSSVIQRV